MHWSSQDWKWIYVKGRALKSPAHEGMEGKEKKREIFSLVSLLQKGLFGWDLTTSRLSCANQRARISVMQIQYSRIVWYIYLGHWTPAGMISKRKQIMQSEWNLWLIYSLTQIFKHLVKMQEAGKHPNKIFYSSLSQDLLWALIKWK